ncbi:helix-turn-helix domain-containing protein [Methylobacterium sp. Leaf100]|uniref:helix-turn-helix domain-containing protein n=1 Tax=Methylobacterium sp. Leaf100 TaxID=1736252 RepID=UPI001AEBACF4|nr:helix-turn-helix domain-containing protein [Methylobacterium sp. Leaf100]
MIRHARTAAGLSQQALAQKLGVSRAAVGQWEGGTHEPSTENLIAVCAVLGVDVGSAVRGEIKPVKPDDFQRNALSAADHFRLLGGLAKTTLSRQYSDPEKLVDLFASHTLDDSAHIYVSKDPFSPYPRPISLMEKEGSYALILSDNYLSPKFEDSDIVYLCSTTPAQINDYVLIYTKETTDLRRDLESEGVPVTKCYLGRLIKRSIFGMEIRHFSPDRILTIKLDAIAAIHRVYASDELIAQA